MTQTTGSRSPLKQGESRSREAGHVIITLTAGVDGYSVLTMAGPTRLDRWSGTFATYTQARDAAEHTRLAFKAHGNEPAIDRRRDQISFDLNVETRRPARQQDRTRIAEIEAELDGLRDLHTLRLEGHLVADVTAFLAA